MQQVVNQLMIDGLVDRPVVMMPVKHPLMEMANVIGSNIGKGILAYQGGPTKRPLDVDLLKKITGDVREEGGDHLFVNGVKYDVTKDTDIVRDLDKELKSIEEVISDVDKEELAGKDADGVNHYLANALMEKAKEDIMEIAKEQMGKGCGDPDCDGCNASDEERHKEERHNQLAEVLNKEMDNIDWSGLFKGNLSSININIALTKDGTKVTAEKK